MTTSDEIRASAVAFLVRLDKEVQRVALDPTHARGGVLGVGHALEAFLRVCLRHVIETAGTTVFKELKRRGVSPGAGTYARALRDADPQRIPDPLVRGVVRELQLPRSRLLRLVGLRNDNAHEPIDASAAKPLLVSTADWLRPLVHPNWA